MPLSGPGVPARNNLAGVQALRGIAATLVVLSHAAGHVNRAFDAPFLKAAFRPGHAGVDLFFVVSGFIILFVHRSDVGRPARTGHYLVRRFTRVWPLYWVALGLTIAELVAAGQPFPGVPDLVASATLMPSFNEPLLGIAWTLQYEVVFYAIFAVLIWKRVLGLVLLSIWAALILTAFSGVPLDRLPPMLYGSFGAQFFMGLAVAFAVQRKHIPFPAWMAVIGGALFLGAMALESAGLLNGYAPAARFVYGPAAMMLVAGAAGAEAAGTVLRLPGWLTALGNATYSIYLFQFVFISVVWQAWQKIGLAHTAPASACFAVLAAAAIGGGLAMSRYVEQPLLRWMRGRRSSTARREHHA